MAANKSVIILLPNGRRQNVQVTPNTTILQMLEEVCQKYGYNADEYDVKHFNRLLDPNSILRFTGLSNNAQLEMVPCTKARSMSNVTICIQLESGERLTSDFTSNSTLTEVLRHLSLDQDFEKTVLIYMHREIHGIDILQKTTLKSLGLNSGKAVLRLIRRDPQQPKTQAHVVSPLAPRFSEVDDTSSICTSNNNHETKPTSTLHSNRMLDPVARLNEGTQVRSLENSEQSQITKQTNAQDSNIHKPEKEQPTLFSRKDNAMESSQYCEEDNTIEHTIEFLGDRNALVFNQAGAQALPRDELPDNFYDLTVDDAKVILRDAKHRREELEDAPLLTDAQRQLNQEKRILNQLHKYKRAVIRIQFPDQFVLQGLFEPLETIQTIKDFIKNYLTDPDSKFEIYTSPPKYVLNPTVRLIDENLVPSAIVYYSGPSVLKSETKLKSVDPRDAGIEAVKVRMAMKRQENEVSHEGTKTVNAANNNLSCGKSSSGSTSNDHKKVPKWFVPPFK